MGIIIVKRYFRHVTEKKLYLIIFRSIKERSFLGFAFISESPVFDLRWS